MKKASPIVSVGIPFYNAEKTLANAIRSVFAQTVSNWELILVDDGSTDSSFEIAKSVRDTRVCVVSDGRNNTLAPRLNQISEMASSPLLARMDADDLMHPSRLEKQIFYLSKNPEVDIVGAGVYSIDASLRPRGKRGLKFTEPSLVSFLLKGLFIHPAIMGRTEWFRNNPYCEEQWAVRAEDYDLWLRTLNRSVFGHTSDLLLFYCEEDSDVMDRLERSYLGALQALKHAKGYGLNPMYIGLACLLLATKMFLYRAAFRIGRPEILISRRNIPLSISEEHEAVTTIQRILRTNVPGLDFSSAVADHGLL